MSIQQNYPLVSIICLSYNHQDYIKEALNSVFNQTYKNIEVIVIDDASPDRSAEVIKEYLTNYPEVLFIPLTQNQGNCKAFNLAFKMSKGNYIIDFALDDVLLQERVERQVAFFETLSLEYGVIFSDVGFIDSRSTRVGSQYKRGRNEKLLDTIPEGDVYKELLERYFISPPSMMVRREVLEDLGGYDETLAYEDFDFWVRSSRKYLYRFQDEVQTLKRILPTSHGSKFSQKRQYIMLASTLKVCEKAYLLNVNREENEALAKRIRFHMRQALFTENFSLVKHFYNLLKKTTSITFLDKCWLSLATARLPLHFFYKFFR